MGQGSGWHAETIPYGKSEIDVRIPARNYLATLTPHYQPGLPDTQAAIQEALAHPVGTPRLCDIARGKRSAVIVVNDVTRPTATDKLVPPLLDELRAAGLARENIFFLVATGTHRDNMREEMERMLGKEVLDEYRVLNHHCQDEAATVKLGATREGIPVVINRLFCEAEVKILTGTIGPHHGAGFSGGRKSVLPGLASLATLKQHHGFHMRSPRPAMGWVEGNRFHEAALEAARMAQVDFIMNTVQNDRKEITHIAAGDLDQAWQGGVRASREIFEVRVPAPAEIVITSPGAFPKDIDLWQAQKAMSSAELMVTEGGTVILAAECRDGVGAQGFYDWMAAASRPQDVIERFIREGFSIGASKAWQFSRCLTRAELIVVTQNLDDRTLEKMFAKRADTVEQAIGMALGRHGSSARILLLRNGSDMIPRFDS